VVTAALPSQEERREFNKSTKSPAEAEYSDHKFSRFEQTCHSEASSQSEARSQNRRADRKVKPQSPDGCETGAQNRGKEQDQHSRRRKSTQENSRQSRPCQRSTPKLLVRCSQKRRMPKRTEAHGQDGCALNLGLRPRNRIQRCGSESLRLREHSRDVMSDESWFYSPPLLSLIGTK
jgi:hypothetical protein